jgi:hypothetical protein
LSYIHSIINQYLKYGYSLIPVDKEKKPCVYWKKYQYKRATVNDILKWHSQFDTLNIGIVTGHISQLAVIDVDDLSLLPELKGKIPEITKTTRVKTNRGYHFYFYLNGNQVKSTNRLFGKNLELKSNGSYIIAPPSIIKNHRYTYEVPLSKMLPIPEKLLKKRDDNIENKHIIFKILIYHGYKMDCIRQILKRDLKEGERNNSLFILYNLLIQNKNSREYARKIVEKKNRSLANPLTDVELKKIYRKAYHYGCSGIREKVSYIQCEQCTYRFRGGQLSGNNILVKNMRILPELTNTQRGIVCLLGTLFDGEHPSIYKIAKTAKMNSATVKKAIKVLKEKHIIDDSLYN